MREFEIGDKVYHPDFGEGIITRMPVNFLNPDETMLEVSFEKERKILGFFPNGRFCKNGEITLRKLEKEEEKQYD